MSQQLSKAGTQATISDRDGRGGLSIALTQPPGSDARWKFSVRASTDEVTIEVGEFITCPPSNSKLSRFVAIANCPGARDWTVMVNLIAGSDDKAVLSMAVGLMTSLPGLSRIAERYKQYEDSGPAVQAILAGETVLGWTVAAGAAGGTLTIDGFGVITITPNGSVSGGGGGLIEGPGTFTFAGDIVSWMIEIAESA
jgi:hypothetical protein